MYCLEKLQRELAYFLDIDLRDLPKVQEILKAQGYTAVKKNDEIIELGGARQSFLEKIPADIAPSTFTKQEIEKLLTQFDNIENLTQHLNTRADSQARQELFHLLESTKNNPNIHYTKDSKDKYLKRFKDNDEHDPYFYLLITKDKDKIFITHLKTRDLNYLEKEILNAESIVKGADIIGDFRQQAGSAKHKSPTSTADSTTNKVFNQGDIKFDIDSYANTNEFKAFNQIKNAEKVVWRQQGDQTHTALSLKETLSLENAKDIIPQPNKQTFQAYKQSLESQGIPIENEVKSFINFVEKNIYNENGVTFTQLNNALKTLNSYYKEAKDPNFKNHIKNAMDSFLREDIKAGIEAIFSQNKSAYKDISSLYATALSDYADMKEVLKIADKLKIRNATTEQNKALDSLLKLAKGQGDKLDNISSLTKALDKDNRALIELNMLSGLFQKSLYDENALQVIDSGKFFKELQALHKDTFQSKEAQDFINIMSDFDRLFKNDILIAKALKPTTTGQIGSSIATSIEGAVKFQMVKNAFSHLVRLMPHIPFMSGLNQKVQGAALRYHLQKALESSFSVSELKHTLQNRIAKAPYTSQTKSQIEKILNRVDTIQDELIEVAERNAKQAQNAKDLQEYQTLQKYGVESLEKLSQDDFNHFVDSVLSGDIEALKSAPNIVYIADLNAELAKELGLNNGKIFLRKNDLHHFRPERKVEYDQAVPREIIKEIPNIINNAHLAYKDPLHKNFFITKELNQVEVMKIAINKDSEGNYIITLSKVEKSSIENQGLEAVGLAPTIPNLNDEAYRTTMLPPSTSKPSNIIPQTPKEIIKQAKQSGKSVAETKKLLQENKELESANNQKIKEFEKKLYEADELARKMEYTSDSSGLSTKSYSHNENLERYFKDKFIDVDDFLTLKKLDKKSAEYKDLLQKMYYKQQEQKANVKALGDLDSNVVAEQSQDYMQNYIKQIHNMSEQELINERKKLLTMPLHNDNMRLMNAQMQEALESFMYPNMKYFTQNPTIYTFLRNGEKFDKRNGAKKLSLQEFDTYRKMLEQDLNLTAIKEFGQNYTEYYRDGVGAIQKLISEAQAHKESGAKGEYKGQVAGAFHRKELGDIDLVWGNGDIGLQKIVEKHLKDFADFAGNNPYEKMSNAINEIIQNGKLLTENGVNTLWYKNGNEYYLVGISKGFNKKGDNNWIITSYKKDNITDLQKEKVDKLFSSDAEVLSAQGKFNELETLNSTTSNIIPQNPTKAQSEYFNSLTNEYEKIKEIKKLHTQDDVLVRVMKINDRYIEPLSNMSVSKEYLQKQTAQRLKENITQAILGNQTQLKALQQGYNIYHLSPFQKEILESVLDIANNPTKLKEYKLQGLQKQLDNLNNNEAYHIEKGREYDKSRYAKDRQELEKEISALKGESSNKILGETMTLKDRLLIDNKIKYSYLKEIAQDLPKPIIKDDFLHLLKNKKYVNIQTPIKELEIEPLKAYEHLTQNSNKQNRIDISGAILPTLQNPLFITKDKKDTYYFYKPFKDEKGVLNIVSIAIPKSNRIRYKTSYIASRERMLKMINEYELVYEAF